MLSIDMVFIGFPFIKTRDEAWHEKKEIPADWHSVDDYDVPSLH